MAAVCVAGMELVCHGLIALASVLWDEPIRTRRAILAEQSARIGILLDPGHTRREALDGRLGWRYRPRFESTSDHINQQGLRALREYAPRPAADAVRVAAFGDSFVYGNEVPDQEAWTQQMERLDPRVEVLNYGVGGYGAGQAYLRFLAEGSELEPQIAILGFVADDLTRVVNVFRRFRSSLELPLAKPRFQLRDDLVLLANPLPTPAHYAELRDRPELVTQLGAFDYWYRPGVYENALHDLSATVRFAVALWDRVRRRFLDDERLVAGPVFRDRSEAFRVQLALFEAFCAAARERGMMPLLVFFPDRASLGRVLGGGPVIYAPLLEAATRAGLPHLDLAQAFAAAAGEEGASLFAAGGHYSRRGNELVARTLLQHLMAVR